MKPVLLPFALFLALAPACTGLLDSPDDSKPPVDLVLRMWLSESADDEPSVRLAFTFPGDPDGTTGISLAEHWGGVGPDREDLVDLTVHTTRGDELEVRPGDVPHQWLVDHDEDAWLTVSARLPANAASLRTNAGGRDHYRPILEPGLFHAIGHLFLPTPSHLEWERERDVLLTYHGFSQRGWEVADSFGVGVERRFTATLGELRAALFLAGDLDLVEPEDCPGLVVAVARTSERGFEFESEDLGRLTGRIVAIERAIMEDTEPAHYLVSAIPVGDPNERGYSFGGTGLTNCFALFLQPNLELVSDGSDGPSGIEIHRLLAHECFHEWNGVRLPLDQPEEESYWFSEGFTNWAAREVLRRLDWLDDEAYAADLSSALGAYHMSAWRNRTAAELGPAFWTDPEAQKQPYLRGDVAAMILDHELRTASGGTDDVFRFLRSLVDEAEGTGLRFDAELLLTRIAERIDSHAGPDSNRGRDVAAALRRVVVHGETAELPEGAFGAGFEVGEDTLHAWDPGLDLQASRDAGRAIGVVEDGPAARAGLADDMVIHGFSYWYGDAGKEIVLTTWDGESETEHAFLPQGEPRTVPVVRVAR